MKRLAFAMILFVVLAGCTSAYPTRAKFGDWEEKALFYLEAQSTTSGPFLSLDAASGSADRYKFGDAVSASSVVSRTTAQPVHGTADFALGQLPITYYLNLSKPITGTLYVTSTTLEAASHDYALWRIEIWVGDQLLGGQQQFLDPVGIYAGFSPMGFTFRPELSTLPEGEKLTLRVTRVTGLTDLVIGTGGAQQSELEIRYFSFNPLSAAVYVEDGQLIAAAGSQSEAEFADAVAGVQDDPRIDGPGPVFVGAQTERGSPGAVLALGALGVLGFALSRRPRRTAMLLLTLALVTGPLSGCLGTSDPEAGPSEDGLPMGSSTAEARTGERPDLVASGRGEIRGIVRNENGLNVPNAHVSVLGTDMFQRTRQDGEFVFRNVTAGKYSMRVDAESYLTLEFQALVEVGRETFLNVTLARPDMPSGRKIHVHDDWGGEPSKVIVEKDILMRSYVEAGVGPGRSWCPGSLRCEASVAMPVGTVVLPGATALEVVITGPGQVGGPNEYDLRIVTATNKTEEQKFLPRKSGQPFRIAFFPNEADAGHSKTSAWSFFIAPSAQSHLFDVLAPPVILDGTVHVRITAFKGVVPFEPVHRDFWGDRSELVLFDAAAASTGCVGCDFPDEAQTKWVPPKGMFVPPGTLEVRGKLTWTNAQNLPLGTTWQLAYQAADMPSGSGFRRAEKVSSSADTFEFVIKPKAEEVDQFYQFASMWRFYPDDMEMPAPNVKTGYGTSWKLTATAIKDPSYQDL